MVGREDNKEKKSSPFLRQSHDILDMYIYWTLSTPWDGSWPYVAMRPEPKSIPECSHMPQGCVSTQGDML